MPLLPMPLAALATGPSWFWTLLVVAGIVAIVAEAVRRQRHRATVASLGRFVERHPGWHRQAWPAGLTTELLVGRFAATPRGDRRYGVEYAVGGPQELALGGIPVTCQVSCLGWWHEVQGRQRSRSGRRTNTYERRSELLVLCQLPVHTRRGIRVLPSSLLGRVGLTREGTQLESDAFNRAFLVEGRDPTLTVTLLDAGVQELLARDYRGRGIELSDDLLVLSGEPSHRDRSLDGVVQTYPAILQDLTRLLRHLPPAFWRQLGLDPDTDGPTNDPHADPGPDRDLDPDHHPDPGPDRDPSPDPDPDEER